MNCDDGCIGGYSQPCDVQCGTTYVGGAYSHAQRRIYLAPHGCESMHHYWHYIDTRCGEARAYPSGATCETMAVGAYSGAVHSPSQQRTYFIPHGEQTCKELWHYIDNTITCDSELVIAYTKTVVDEDGESSDDSDADSPSDSDEDDSHADPGGAFSATQNRIYFPPYSIDCSAPAKRGDTQLAPVLNRHTRSNVSYAGLIPDLVTDRIYLVPKYAGGRYRYIDCKAGLKGGYSIKKYRGWCLGDCDVWRGGALSPGENRIYLAPSEGSHWAAISTPSETVADHRIAANPLFNGSL